MPFMCFKLIRIASSFVSCFYVSIYCQLSTIWLWVQFGISSISCLVCRFFFLCFHFLLLPYLIPFVCFLKLFCCCCSTFLCPLLSWSSKCFNLAITLAITFCWKRDSGGGVDSFEPNKKWPYNRWEALIYIK